MTAEAKQISHLALDSEKALRLTGRFEATHLPFSLAGRLMGRLGAIVRSMSLNVNHRRHHGFACRTIAR